MNVRTLVYRYHWSRLSQMLLSSTPLSRFINVPGFLPIRWMASASITFLLVICCSLPITLACQWIACVVSSTCSATVDFPLLLSLRFPCVPSHVVLPFLMSRRYRFSGSLCSRSHKQPLIGSQLALCLLRLS